MQQLLAERSSRRISRRTRRSPYCPHRALTERTGTLVATIDPIGHHGGRDGFTLSVDRREPGAAPKVAAASGSVSLVDDLPVSDLVLSRIVTASGGKPTEGERQDE